MSYTPYIHPRFIACMIRLGDLLDFDSNRFNAYSIAMVKEMPETSLLHKQKHASVKHKLISPLSIEAELDCQNESVYRMARSWFDWLEKEVEKQSREWSNITPDDLGGLPPMISKNSIKILYNGLQASPDLLNLKFTMSQDKIFNILQGGGIYKEPGLTFIREIVQNSFDATKLQIWSDINNGLYDIYFEEQNKNKNSINFPDDIPLSIYKQYPIKLSVKWKDSEKTILHIECTDKGTGISEKTLLRMTQNVGESYKKDSGYEELYKSMPYWLRPTAAFGIGIQSIFFVAQSFEIETSYPGESSKLIKFRSAANNQYCSIIKENINHKRGTTIKVDILKDKFAELFGTSFSTGILGRVDVLQGNGDDIYLAKIDNFAYSTFKDISDLKFTYETENSERSFETNRPEIKELKSVEDDYKWTCYNESGILTFYFYEKKNGSTFELWFNNNFNIYIFENEIKLRDIKIKNAKLNYFKTAYCGFSWNLNNQTTDKIVDISRDNLTYNGRQWVANTLLNELLPKCLELIKCSFETNMSNEQTFNVQYFNYCLTAMACRRSLQDESILKTITLPLYIVSKNREQITAREFFKENTIYIIKDIKTNGLGFIAKEDQMKIEETYQELLSGKIIVWEDHYLSTALQYNFVCTEIVKYKTDIHLYKLEKRNNTDNKLELVSCKDNSYIRVLKRTNMYNCSRNSIYAIQGYDNIVVKNKFISGFESFPAFSECHIYSPFSKKSQIEALLEYSKDRNDELIKDYIDRNLNEYITPYLIEIIKNDSYKQEVTEDIIKSEYRNLILNFVKETFQEEQS